MHEHKRWVWKVGEKSLQTRMETKYLTKDKEVTSYTTIKNNNANPNTCDRNSQYQKRNRKG